LTFGGSVAQIRAQELSNVKKLKNGGLDQYGKVQSLNGIGGEMIKMSSLAVAENHVNCYLLIDISISGHVLSFNIENFDMHNKSTYRLLKCHLR